LLTSGMTCRKPAEQNQPETDWETRQHRRGNA
jgi:hypothetical protein